MADIRTTQYHYSRKNTIIERDQNNIPGRSLQIIVNYRKSSIFYQSYDRITSRAFTPQYGLVYVPYFTVYDRIRPVFFGQGIVLTRMLIVI